MKIVINKCYGGFSLSDKACAMLGIEHSHSHIERNDPKLIEVVEQLGAEANGSCAELKVIEIPDDVKFVVQEYDGIEWVAEEHRTWS